MELIHSVGWVRAKQGKGHRPAWCRVLATYGTLYALPGQEDSSHGSSAQAADNDSHMNTGEPLGTHLLLFIWHLPLILSNWEILILSDGNIKKKKKAYILINFLPY